jgi:acetyltransferase-like isoleucine patch superfamily enzyme
MNQVAPSPVSTELESAPRYGEMEGKGRGVFEKYGRVINAIRSASRLLPRRFYQSTYFIFDAAPGNLGMFFRYLYACRLTKRCGMNVTIGKRVTVKDWSGLSIGDNVAIHTGVYIDATGGVSIGDNTSIGHYASLLSFDHTWDDPTLPMKYNRLRFEPIEIGSDVLVFAAARVLAGARIQNAYTSGLYAGVPAKLIKAF